MEWITKIAINISLKCLLIFPVVLGFFLSVPHAEAQVNLFKIEAEREISSLHMNCNYENEDLIAFSYNFEYPMIIMRNGNEPLVVFIDEQSNTLLFTNISDMLPHVVYSSHLIFGKANGERWPIVIAKKNKLYLNIYEGNNSSEMMRIKLFQIDEKRWEVNHRDKMVFSLDDGCGFWGVFPYAEEYMVIGQCSSVCLKKLPGILLGGNPTVLRNAAFILDNKQKLIRQPIEEDCHNISKQEYEISDSNTMHAVWVQDKGGIKFEYVIRYSNNSNGREWAQPINLYSVSFKGMMDIDRPSISMASSGDSAFVLWQDMKKGIFLAEIAHGNKVNTVTISEKKKGSLSQEPMVFASTIKVASNKSGNVFVLWAQNSGKEYKLYFKARIDEKWSSEIIINQGLGYLKLPDMKVDEKGKVHIVFIKSTDLGEPNGRYGCFYMSLSKIVQ